MHLVGKVLVERPAVDRPLAGARDEADAGDGFLAAAGGISRLDRRGARLSRLGGEGFGSGVRMLGCRRLGDGVGHVLAHGCGHWATWLISYGTGFCAWCGCSEPA